MESWLEDIERKFGCRQSLIRDEVGQQFECDLNADYRSVIEANVWIFRHVALNLRER